MSEHLPTTEPEPQVLGRTIPAWREYLTGDNLDVPASRYGRDASECAVWAMAAFSIIAAHSDEPDEASELADYCMSLAVNDHDDVMELVLSHRQYVPSDLLEELGVEGGAA